MKKHLIFVICILLVQILYAESSLKLKSPFKSDFTISRTFGYYKNASDALELHEGIDFVVNSGTAIYPVLNGTVIEVGFNNELGNYVTIIHSNNYTSRYCNLNSFRVKKGQKVTTKNIIATSGNTGISTGPHMCFRLYDSNNIAINPTEYFKNLPKPTTPPDQELLNSSFQEEEITDEVSFTDK